MDEANQKPIKYKKIKIALSVLSALVCAFFALILILYVNLGKIINSFADVELIKTSVQKETGLILNFEKPLLATTKDLCLNLKSDELSIYTEDNSKVPLLKIKDADLKIKIPPLFFKRIVFKKVSVSLVLANIVREKDGKFNFEKYIKKDGKFPFKLTAKNANLLCKNYLLNFKDNFVGEEISVSGKELVSVEFDFDKVADIKTKGEIIFKKGKSNSKSPYELDLKLKFPLNKNLDFRDYKLLANVSNLNLEYLYPYMSEFVSKDIKRLNGNAAFSIAPAPSNMLEVRLDLKDVYFVIFKNNTNNIVDIPNESSLAFKTSFAKDEVSIKDLKFLKDGINISAYGSLKNLSNSKKINPDLTFEIKDTLAANALKIMPDNVIKLQQPYILNLKKYGVNGIVNGKFTIKNRFRYPNLYGKLQFKDVYVLERPKNAKTSEGSVEFDGNKVKISVLANCPNSQNVTVTGTTEIAELPFARFQVNSTKAVDLEFAHKILIPVSEILGLELGPLPYMTIKGTGFINLKTEGTRQNSNLNGYFDTSNGEAVLDGLNTRFTNCKMHLVFKGKQIFYNGTTGLVEGAKAYFDGFSDVTGKLDLKFKVQDVEAKKILNITKTSPMTIALLNGAEFLEAYQNPTGFVDFNLRLFGKADKDAKFGDFSSFDTLDSSLKADGSIVFKNNTMKIFPEIYTSKINGVLKFTDFVTLDLKGDIYNSPFTVTGSVAPDTKASKKRSEQPQIVDLTFKSKNVASADLYSLFYLNQDGFNSKNKIDKNLYDFLNKIKFKFACDIRARGKVAPNDKTVDLRKFNLDGYAVGMNYKGADVHFNSGMAYFSGQKITFRNLNTLLWGANVVTNGHIDKIFDEIFMPNMEFKLLSFPVQKLADLSSEIKSASIKKLSDDFVDPKGTLNGSFSYTKNGFTGTANFNQISLYDKKRELPIVVKSGDIKFTGDSVKLNTINMTYGTTPIYTDANLENLTKTPSFNIFVTTNLNEESLDKLLNPLLQYPLKAKGEFTLRGRLRGTSDNYTVFTTLKFEPGADIYYMGANLGDISELREINSRIDFKNDEINLNNATYRKFILSQNNKQTPYEMLKLSGRLSLPPNAVSLKDGIILNNVRFQTPNPAPARLLNIFFKKSVLKQGNFTSNLLLSGSSQKPDVIGNINFSNVDMPLYDANIKDIDLVFNKDVINAVIQGTGMGSDVKVTAEVVNSFSVPYVVNHAKIESNKISLSDLISGLGAVSKAQKTSDLSQKQQFTVGPHDFLVKDGKIFVREVSFNKAVASNVSGRYTHSGDGLFKFSDVDFTMAGGKISSKGSYNFDSAEFKLESLIENCDANALSTEIMGVSNQIFGNLNGKINLAGRELNTPQGINNLQAAVNFTINDGKMPKLGSLEYLLRAGNLIKSGILGFTINNVIEVLIPYRTGDFKQIKGNFIVQDGKVDDLEIFSRGENLSIYTKGSFDIASNIGEFEVLGKLSTKISNLLGPIGNASVSSIMSFLTNNKFYKGSEEELIQDLDKIPDIDGSSLEFRYFAAKIFGDLNKEGYVRSFNWLN